MEFSKISYQVEEGLARITLQYPKNLNTIDEAMADELLAALTAAETDPTVKVLLLEGHERAFSAGGDVGYFYELVQSGQDISIDALLHKVAKITLYMKSMSKLIVASVSGAVAGAGVSLALSADFVLASQTAKFILAFVNLGLVPDTGATYILTKQLGEKRAFEYCATGKLIQAEEAKEWGLVNQVVTMDDLHQESMEFALELAQGPTVAYKNIKRQIYGSAYADYRAYLQEIELPTQQECVQTEDFREGVKAFIEKRKANFKGY